MTKLTKLIIVCASAAIVVGALVWWLFATPGNEVRIGEKIHLLKETIVPMRLKVIARSDGSAQVAVKFFDVDGKAVGRCEQQYAGGGITLRFMNVEIDGRHIYFPYEMTQLSETDTLRLQLQQYYISKGFPMVYDTHTGDALLRDEIGVLYQNTLTLKRKKLEALYGCTAHIVEATLSEPMERVNYSVIVKADGGIEFGN
ncbi:MAG: hypothetical protein IIT32_09480 [Bacteroidales bacterium]|nr:hypothetical protein [Bacteroidales bacterium]